MKPISLEDIKEKKTQVPNSDRTCPLKAKAVEEILCKKSDCQEPARLGYAYCSKEHAPFANLSDKGDGTDV